MWQACNNDEGHKLIFLDVGYDNLDGKEFVKEQKYKNIEFFRHNYNQYKKSKSIFIVCLVEFGCEWLIPHYLLPKIAKAHKDKNIIVVGWYGREFLYKHLVDEFWELSDKYMSLRETTRALHHHSKTIKKLEIYLKKFGDVVPSSILGSMLVQAKCASCNKSFGSRDKKQSCPFCDSKKILQSFFSSPEIAIKDYLPLPKPSVDAVIWANKTKIDNMVGIFARSRKSYGRNLDTNFYIELINNLQKQGYNPVWFGEKESVHKCPVDGILDLTCVSEARKLSYIISLLKHCVFTIQFWTASTRLSLEANCPFILVESPDQLYGAGQEGIRLKLLNRKQTKNKIILCNYKKVCNNLSEFNSIIMDGISELKKDDTSVKIGLVDDCDYVNSIIEKSQNE